MGGAFHPGADQAEYHSRASRYGLWPRVYRSDNNVVDHQVVNMEFEGGATAMFSMCGFTYEQERRIQIMGTRGELRGEEGKITVYDFLTGQKTEITIPSQSSGHGGATAELWRAS